MSDLLSRIDTKLLTAEDDVSGFECGSEPWAVEVAAFLREDALAQQNEGLNKTHLFLLDGELAGFVSVLAYSLQLRGHSELPDRVVGRTTVPVVLLGQLGVHRRLQGMGIGRMILAWTRYEVSQLSVGVRFFILHCHRDNPALSLYRSERFFEADREREDGRTLLLMAYDITSSVQ